MRIRSIKPEFYRSEDIASLDWDSRLVFIGLWSYVDDNGVGRDVERLIAADLFPLEVDPTETLRRLSLALNHLHEQGLIARYVGADKPLLFITGWERHQLVKNPNKARYPRPDGENVTITEPLRTSSVEPPENLPPVTGEQGNRGTGEQKEIPSSTKVDGLNSKQLESLFDEFWSAYPKRVAKAAARRRWDTLVKRGTDPQTIIDGAKKYAASVRGTDPQYVKQPDGWLNAGRWEDEAAPTHLGSGAASSAELHRRASDPLLSVRT